MHINGESVDSNDGDRSSSGTMVITSEAMQHGKKNISEMMDMEEFVRCSSDGDIWVGGTMVVL